MNHSVKRYMSNAICPTGGGCGRFGCVGPCVGVGLGSLAAPTALHRGSPDSGSAPWPETSWRTCRCREEPGGSKSAVQLPRAAYPAGGRSTRQSRHGVSGEPRRPRLHRGNGEPVDAIQVRSQAGKAGPFPRSDRCPSCSVAPGCSELLLVVLASAIPYRRNQPPRIDCTVTAASGISDLFVHPAALVRERKGRKAERPSLTSVRS